MGISRSYEDHSAVIVRKAAVSQWFGRKTYSAVGQKGPAGQTRAAFAEPGRRCTDRRVLVEGAAERPSTALGGGQDDAG